MKALKASRVLVTRPQPANQVLAKKIEAQGGIAITCPLIEIIDLKPTPPAADFDIAIVTSQHAAAYASRCRSKQILAIGPSSGRLLNKALIAPPPYNSEALLTMDCLNDIAGKKILILKGEGGRDYLVPQLRARGAEVEAFLVYRRQASQAQLPEPEVFDIATITSNEILSHYHQQYHRLNHADILSKPLLVCAERQAQLAEKLKFKQILIAQSAQDDAILKRLIQWRVV